MDLSTSVMSEKKYTIREEGDNYVIEYLIEVPAAAAATASAARSRKSPASGPIRRIG